MTTGEADRDYAPYPLVSDGERFGLARSSVSSAFGTAVIHSKRTSRSRRATIFLHGAAGSWTTWTPMLTCAAEADLAIVNPVVIDLPGWGEGVLTASGERAAIEAVCTLVKEGAESLGYTEWDIVGHSMGGFIALHMAAIWPECVSSVATVSATSWSVIDAVEHPVRHFWRLPQFILLWRAMQGMAAFGTIGARLAGGLGRVGLLRPAVAPLFRHPFRIPRTVISALGSEVRPRAFATAVQIAKGYDARASWSRIDCPVRAVQGDRDVFARASDLQRLGEVLPNSHREIIKDCGHFALIERPREVLAAFGYESKPTRSR
jgi:pimeloyl-ACP methyl ester carboxylesterase